MVHVWLAHQLRLDVPQPFHGEALLVFLGRHAVAGVEAYRDRLELGQRRIDYARTLRLPSGPAALELSWQGQRLSASVRLSHPRDLELGRRRVEQLCDLDRDVGDLERRLKRDCLLTPLVTASPGLRVPGVVDLHEHLIRTMIGQQISLAGAANCAGKLVIRYGEPMAPTTVETAAGALTSLFPTAKALAGADPATLPMPAARGRALVSVAKALASGELVLTPDSDPVETRQRLLNLRGIGPWTTDYVLMRGLRQPDVLLASDLVVKRELARLGAADPTRWSPWRSYATMHLWRAWTQ